MMTMPVTPPQELQPSAALDVSTLLAHQVAEQALSAQFSMALSNFMLMQEADDDDDDDDEGFL